MFDALLRLVDACNEKLRLNGRNRNEPVRIRRIGGPMWPARASPGCVIGPNRIWLKQADGVAARPHGTAIMYAGVVLQAPKLGG